MSVEVHIEPVFEEIEFTKLPKSRSVYCGSYYHATYLCHKCRAVVVGKVDHARWHQEQLEFMIGIAHRTIQLEDVRRIHYKPVEVAPTP